ncbi:MAG: hypothetical protein KGJ55_04060 [Gammaproteobacteria bacterium]|nr:hypothetical protein [Gammaproteobacteria bacterium]
MRHQDLEGVFAIILSAAALLGPPAAQAASCAPMQPLPAPGSWSVVTNGDTTTIDTAPSFFPPGDSFGPNPTNLLPTVYEDSCDAGGNPIPNTLPSTPEHPYNLHPDPVVTPLPNKLSPTNDLAAIIKALHGGKVSRSQIQFAIDILEGNPVNRLYSGFPVLHYNGPLKGKTVTPTLDANGNVVGGTVNIHMIYYDSHIESDTSYVDPTAVNDVPWTIHYTVDVLDRGSDDFAGYIMYFNAKLGTANGGKPNVGLDDSFFPMSVGQDSERGQRYQFDMKMAPAAYWNLTYHWGWRIHPPRVQVTENFKVPINGNPRNFSEFQAFCPTHAPNATGDCPELRTDPAFRTAAINMIGDIAPAKRMWNDFRAIQAGAGGSTLKSLIADLDSAFDDWQHRTRLPKGVPEDPNYDETLLFVNNTIYGHVTGFTRDMQMEVFKYTGRGSQIKVKLFNGDYYNHAYVLVDFGGIRGWENTFQNTLPLGGQGPLFTFGRNHWWVNTASGALPIPVATRPPTSSGTVLDFKSMKGTDDPRTPLFNRIDARRTADMHTRLTTADPTFGETLGAHDVIINFHYDPSPRLRMYQFDALHHDEAIWSPH